MDSPGIWGGQIILLSPDSLKRESERDEAQMDYTKGLRPSFIIK